MPRDFIGAMTLEVNAVQALPERLLGAIEDRQRAVLRAHIAVREKERRRKSPRPAVLKKKILESKRKRSGLKKLRGRVED